MTLLDFDELPLDSGVALSMLDRGVLTARSSVGSIGLATEVGRTLFVAMNGSDTTGNGTLTRPFRDIQAAVTRAVALGAGAGVDFSILVFPGTYTAFQLAKGCFVQGLGHPSSIFINTSIANILEPTSWASGSGLCGVSNLTFSSAVTLENSTLNANITLSFYLANIFLRSGANLTFTGGASSGFIDLFLKNILAEGSTSPTLNITNIQNSSLGAVDMRNGNVTFASTRGSTQTHRVYGLSSGGVLSATNNQSTNLIVQFMHGLFPVNPTGHTITGDRTQVYTRSVYQVTGPDAATTFSFGNIPNAAGATIMPQGAENTIEANPTAARTYTFEGGGIAGTRVRIINFNGANAITLAYGGGAAGPAGAVGANTSLELISTSATQWRLAG